MGTLRWILLAVPLVSCGPAADPPPSDPPRHNVLLFVIDTLRADALGAYGNPTVETPRIDAFAAEGVLFERAYAPTSWTRASVASILTGQHPDTHGLNQRDEALPQEVETLAERLSDAGYATAAIVANPNVGSAYGFDQGWDEYVELYQRRAKGRVASGELVADAGRVTRRALRWLDGARSPFFLFVLAIDPHWPYTPPPRFDRYGRDYSGPVRDGAGGALAPDLDAADRERIRAYYHGEVSYGDHWFGRLVDGLERRGLADETVVVLTSDHGEEFWEHGQRFHNKALFEESIRVPLILRHPGSLPAGRRVRAPVELVDLVPTLLSLVGLPVPGHVDGRSLDLAAASSRRAIFSTLEFEKWNKRALTIWPWRLHHDADTQRSALFHLEEDPGELHDRLRDEPQRGADMLEDLSRRTTGATNRPRPARVPDEALTEESREALRALGYIEPE
ncbi:MAG: sulfatase family protein [Myxococcota bacterium]